MLANERPKPEYIEKFIERMLEDRPGYRVMEFGLWISKPRFYILRFGCAPRANDVCGYMTTIAHWHKEDLYNQPCVKANIMRALKDMDEGVLSDRRFFR